MFDVFALQSAHAFLVGTKYDLFTTLPPEEMEDIDKQARKYAKAMKAPLIFSSASHSINVQKMFKIVLSKVFDLKSTVAEITAIGEPLLIFTPPDAADKKSCSEGSSGESVPRSA